MCVWQRFIVVSFIFALFADAALAVGVVDFRPVAFRKGTNGEYGTITEYATEDGVSVTTLEAGQKVYYGTDYFNGLSLSSLNYVQFTYEKDSGNSPYVNIIITDGNGSYGIVSSSVLTQTTNLDGSITAQFSFADQGDDSLNFYEPFDTDPLSDVALNLAEEKRVDWSDVSTWTLLGVGDTRPLSQETYSYISGSSTLTVDPEGTVMRGPVTDAVTINWGDSLSNYVGSREIYSVLVSVTVDGDDRLYVAGAVVPEPGVIAVLALGMCGLVAMKRCRN